MKLLKCLHSRANPFQHVIFCPSASQIHGTFQKEFVNHMHDKDVGQILKDILAEKN